MCGVPRSISYAKCMQSVLNNPAFQNNYVFQLSFSVEIEDYNWMSSVGGSGNADVW